MIDIKPELIKNIAHRGARSLAPENTIQAAKKALECGADGWELDVAMSSDGVLVVLHDDTLERTSNVEDIFPNRNPWTVYDFTLEELYQLDFGSWFIEQDPFGEIELGNVPTSEVEKFTNLKITTLREALMFTKENNWWVNIEIKDASGTFADPLIVIKVVELVKELGMTEQVLISSFNHQYLHQVKDINPEIATGVLVDKSIGHPTELMAELQAQAFHPNLKNIRLEQVQLLHEKGYDINVWTVNEETDMKRLIEMGVTGIFTDFPQRLNTLLTP